MQVEKSGSPTRIRPVLFFLKCLSYLNADTQSSEQSHSPTENVVWQCSERHIPQGITHS
jgi:hypothetical protein